ncbi:major capsid protein P2 [Iodobacter sp. CM08]|uniref:major capsid protein P2 n=1 Tax=Iodobacter sp. CM08 TaxID=3085902 RepID=UPI002982418D|nr:major capsid protein P2 [Iodobacter sp. CM08]MDW5417051.1 major capsid protein P2 [Iodobacter sp. CM08]
MTMQKKEMPFMNVVAGSTASLSLPCGPTYERLYLRMTGTTFNKTHITDIRVKVNGKLIHQADGITLEAFNAYSGMATDANILTVDFTEIFARDRVGQSIGALGTARGVNSVMLEVDIAGTAVAPTLECWSFTSGPADIGVLNKLLKYPVNIGGAGKWPIALPYGPNGTMIKRVYIKSANCTGLEIKKNGVVIHDTTKPVNEFWQKENRKTPQAGFYIFDPATDNNYDDMLRTDNAGSLEFNVYMSGLESIMVYGEYLDPLANL